MEGNARDDVVAMIGRLAERQGIRIATAESLTGGLLASDLSRDPTSDAWFSGGVVACADEVKRNVLCVRPGPVVSERAALDMADGVALLLGATDAVAVSGVPGPATVEGNHPGTVWVAVRHGTATLAEVHHLAGEPDDICATTRTLALALLLRTLTEDGSTPG